MSDEDLLRRVAELEDIVRAAGLKEFAREYYERMAAEADKDRQRRNAETIRGTVNIEGLFMTSRPVILPKFDDGEATK